MNSVCPHFLKGSCHFGRRCWNSHDIPSTPNEFHNEETTLRAATAGRTVLNPFQIPSSLSSAPRMTQGQPPQPALPRSDDEQATLRAPTVGRRVLHPFEIPSSLRGAPRIIQRQLPHLPLPQSDDEQATLRAPTAGRRVLHPFQIPSSLRGAPRILQRLLPHTALPRAVVARTVPTPVELPAISSNEPRTVHRCEIDPSFPLSDARPETIIDTVLTGPVDKSGVDHEVEKIIENELRCDICQDVYIKPTVLNCTHTFCYQCIESWTSTVNKCPLCREPVTNKTFCRSLDAFIKKITQLLPEKKEANRETLQMESENITDEIVDATGEQELFFDPPLMVANDFDFEDSFIESGNDENSVFCTYCGSLEHSLPNCLIQVYLQ